MSNDDVSRTPIAFGDARLADEAAALLRLARSDRQAARRRLSALSADDQAAACAALDAKGRGLLLTLVDSPEAIVPRMPETELAHAILASGVDQAGWLLAFATEEQLVACIDIDCFDLEGFQPERMGEWVDALIEAGTPTLLAAFDEIDPEIWVLALRAMASFSIGDPNADGFTEDGVVFYTPNTADDYDRVREIVQTLQASSPRRYWELVYAALDGATAECEEWALRWREARLADLGFPPREQAMRVYEPLRADAVVLQEAAPRPWTDAAMNQTAVVPSRLGRTLLGDALRQLPAARATELLGYVAGVANALAVADRLPLGDPDTAQRTIDRALRGIERGLGEVARHHDLAAHEVLDRATPLDLFRAGAAADPTLGRSRR